MMKKLICVALLAMLAGCKTIEPMYYHGEYNSAVYSYFKAEEVSIEEQILMMLSILQNAEAQGKPVAPGAHAHLGMLYFESGNSVDGLRHFEMEKTLFPESTQYIDFLIASAQGGNNAS